jgi:hypothetical protein
MKYSHLYTTCTQKSVIDDRINIIATFKSALKTNPGLEVKLINYYKGMPLSLDARILSVHNESIDLLVNPRQAVAISDDNYTFIRSNLFSHDIVARAQDVDINEKTVTLSKFCFIELCAERRNHLRLRIHPPIDAIYMSSSGTVRGELIELSTAGTIMVVDYTVEIDTWEEGKLIFNLPDANGENNKIKIPAKFLTLLDDARLSRFIFCFTPDKNTENLIAKYLFNRQIEIMRMLKDGSELGLRK